MPDNDMLDASIRTYQDKLRQNPNSLVFVQLADAYRKKGNLEEALAACKEGLERNPNLLSGLIMLGRIHAASRQPGEAVEVLRRVVQREPNNLTAHALLSQAYMQLNHFSEAIAEYQKILTLNPEDTAAQQALQVALDRMRKEGGAAPRGAAASAPLAPAGPPSAPERVVSAAPRESAGGARDRGAPMEVPAYAAAVELAERGLYEEAIEAFQRILEADPENYMARQKLREVYAQREATEAPAAPEASGETGDVQANKISDDEILYLLGLMEAAAPAPAAAAAPPAAPHRPAETAISAPPAAAPAPAPSPVAAPEPAPPRPAPAAVPSPAEGRAAPPPPAEDGARIAEILARLAATEGMRQAYLVAGDEVIASGREPDAAHVEKVHTLVRLLADVSRRTATQMKQGEIKQLLVFGTEGMVMVSPSTRGILAAVAGAGVKVGLLRLALTDCLKRLAGVS